MGIHEKRAKTRRPEGGMLRVKNVDPRDMLSLLERCTGDRTRYARSIKRDVKRWLQIRCPTILPVNGKNRMATVSAKHASTLQTFEA